VWNYFPIAPHEEVRVLQGGIDIVAMIEELQRLPYLEMTERPDDHTACRARWVYPAAQ
jgi:hypothetical protein